MTEPNSRNSPGVADWLFKGVLTKVGDTVDRLTGRKWTPSSSLATSELIERIKKLLNAEMITVAGKGNVVPHNIKLKIQWDKFATDSDTLIDDLRNELLTATIDHINDSNYYTLAPVNFEVATDYFVEGVKLQAGFDRVIEDDREVEMNVTVPAFNVKEIDIPKLAPEILSGSVKATYTLAGEIKEQTAETDKNGRISVGRASNSALSIKDNSVSSIHATLSISENGSLSVADTGSTNGTFVNDERIAYGKVVDVPVDAKVRFGVVNVEFEVVRLPEVIQPIVETVEEETDRNSVTIDGFEFRSKVTEPEVESQPEILEDTLKVAEVPSSDAGDAIEMPSQKL
ncbi:MAG TPA: FHA domain-containing protein [Pyrinomonadaceae bacterium]|nr:FHA domain-containing protein [Pyrinomonadaceae bacterium]